MGTLMKGLLRVKFQPQLQFVRCKTKINVTKPRPPHFERALLEHVCKPYFEKERLPQYIPNYEACDAMVKKQKVEEDHPLKLILAKEYQELFQNAKLIAFFQWNTMTPEEKFQCQLILKKNGMKLHFFSKTVLHKAFTGTKYESVLGLFDAPTATALGPQPDVYKLMSIVKKLPKLVLMAAVVENKFLSVRELEECAKYKNFDEIRGALVALVNSGSQNIVQIINYQTTNLVGLLNQHKKMQEA